MNKHIPLKLVSTWSNCMFRAEGLTQQNTHVSVLHLRETAASASGGARKRSKSSRPRPSPAATVRAPWMAGDAAVRNSAALNRAMTFSPRKASRVISHLKLRPNYLSVSLFCIYVNTGSNVSRTRAHIMAASLYHLRPPDSSNVHTIDCPSLAEWALHRLPLPFTVAVYPQPRSALFAVTVLLASRFSNPGHPLVSPATRWRFACFWVLFVAWARVRILV